MYIRLMRASDNENIVQDGTERDANAKSALAADGPSAS